MQNAALMTTEKEHKQFIDTLRCFAIIAVLLQHVVDYYVEVFGKNRITYGLFASSRWNILVFVMISGFLFLGRDISIGRMWSHYIKRIILTFLFWSVSYCSYNFFFANSQIELLQRIKQIPGDVLSGGTRRLWYLVMLVPLYALIPLLQKWMKSLKDQEVNYALIFMGVTSLFLPTIYLIHPVYSVIGLDIDRIRGVFDSAFVFYLIFGYWYISRCCCPPECGKKWNRGGYLLLVFSRS